MSTHAVRTGRRPGRHDTRAELLIAARECFAEYGYEGTTTRRVAALAGVDAAMVHRHFGTKQQLLLAAIGMPQDLSDVLASTLAGDRATAGTRVVRRFVELWDAAPAQEGSFRGLLQLAATDPAAAHALRDYLTQTISTGLTRVLGDRPYERRVGLIGSQLLGIAVARYVIGLEPVASATPRQLAAEFGWVVQDLLLPRGRR